MSLSYTSDDLGLLSILKVSTYIFKPHMSTLAWLSDWMNYCRGGLLLTWIIAGSMVDEELAPEQELSFDAIMCLNGAI